MPGKKEKKVKEKKVKKKRGKKDQQEAVEELEEALEQEGRKKKKKKKKILLLIPILVLAIGAGAFFFLRSRGPLGGASGEEPPEEKEPEDIVEAPENYSFGEGEPALAALPVFSENVVVHAPEPPEAAEGEDPITAVTYRYEGFEDAKGMLTSYAGLLTAADVGFVYVDEDLTVAEAPDFEAESGTALLAKAGNTEGSVNTIELIWTAEEGTVVTDTVEGQIRQPRPETLSLSQAEDYVRSLSPAALGLSGESMDEYNVYPLAGSVLVDGKPCLHISVYSVDAASGTNVIAGEYFISADKSHIYRRDAASGRVSVVS